MKVWTTPELAAKWENARALLSQVNVEKNLNQRLVKKLILQKLVISPGSVTLWGKFQGKKRMQD